MTHFLMKTPKSTNNFIFKTSAWGHVGWKKNCYGKKIPLSTFFSKCETWHSSKINSFLDLKLKSKKHQKLRTNWYNGKLHESMIVRINIFVQLWNFFPEELKTKKTKQEYIHKCNWRSFREVKNDLKIINITVTRSTENATMQDLQFVHIS